MRISWLILIVAYCFVDAVNGAAQVKLGVENLLGSHLDLIEGKSVGLIANHTSLDSNGKHVFHRISGHSRVSAIFGPEHGFQGDVEDGASIQKSFMIDIPIYSLYGSFRTPTPNMLREVDVLIYDIQDVGVKFYTYISNLFLSMIAAKREGIPIVVLDRPNPIDATLVEGGMTNPVYCSFVSAVPLPMRYGMTVGEMSKLFNEEHYAGFALGADLTVVEMTGYSRKMWYDETGVPWTATSPNMPTLETAILYPGTCLIEGTNLSEGRGTDSPFLTIGAPYINGKTWLNELPKEVLAGIEAEPISFTPKRIENKVLNPKYKDVRCNGLHFQITDRTKLRPIELAVALLCAAQKLYPEKFELRRYLDNLWGNEDLRAMVSEGMDYKTIMETTQEGIRQFETVRKKYLLYE